MAEEAPAERSSRPDPLSVLWHALSAPQALLVLLGLLVLTLVAAGLVPQIPLWERGNPLQWLAAQSDIAGRDWIRNLRMYDLWHSLWARMLLALLGAVLLVRLARTAEIAWRASAQGRWQGPLRPLTRAGYRAEQVSPLPPAEAMAEIGQRFSGHKARWLPALCGPIYSGLASRRVWALWAAPVVYAGSLAALVGALLLTTWGWQTEKWLPNAGESRAVDAGKVTAIRMESFALQRDRQGKVTTATQVSWRAGERELGRASVTGGHPATRHGLAVRQLGYVPILSIRGWDADGRPLILQEDSGPGLPTDVEVAFPDPESRPVLVLEKLNRLLVLSFEEGSGSTGPALRLSLTTGAGDEPTPLGTLYESGSISVEDLQLHVNIAFRPLLRVDHLPGAALVVAGSGLALGALILLWLARPKLVRVSAVAEPGAGARVRTETFPPETGYEPQGAPPEDAGQSGKAKLRASALHILYLATQALFLVLGAGVMVSGAWAWRTTGSLSGQAVSMVWALAGLVLAAMSLLAWNLGGLRERWAALLAGLSAAAAVACLFA